MSTYVTRAGDTFDAIAKRESGAERYMDLWIYENPEHEYVARFESGVVLNVPTIPEPERPDSLPPWRRP